LKNRRALQTTAVLLIAGLACFGVAITFLGSPAAMT
jgi:hypothetical protein